MNQEEAVQKVLFKLQNKRVIEPCYALVLSNYLKQIYSIGYDSGLTHFSNEVKKPVLMYNKKGVFIREFESISQAARITEINFSNIGHAANGRRSTAGGYFWQFKKI